MGWKLNHDTSSSTQKESRNDWKALHACLWTEVLFSLKGLVSDCSLNPLKLIWPHAAQERPTAVNLPLCMSVYVSIKGEHWCRGLRVPEQTDKKKESVGWGEWRSFCVRDLVRIFSSSEYGCTFSQRLLASLRDHRQSRGHRASILISLHSNPGSSTKSIFVTSKMCSVHSKLQQMVNYKSPKWWESLSGNACFCHSKKRMLHINQL